MNKKLSEADFLRAAIGIAGGKRALAEMLGISYQAIFSWQNQKSGLCPVKRAIQIEKVLNGKITKEDLRPDIFCSEEVL